MFMLNSNKPIKVAHFQKLANQSMFWSFDEGRNVLIEKKLRDMGSFY